MKIIGIDPGKYKSAIVLLENGKYIDSLMMLTDNFIANPTVLRRYFGIRQPFTVIVEGGYINPKSHKGEMVYHILLCGKFMGALISHGFKVVVAPPMEWIPQMYSQHGQVPTSKQLDKLAVAWVYQEFNVTVNPHLAAAISMAVWWYRKNRLQKG